MTDNNNNNLDFSFGEGADIFGDFTPDLTSLQAIPEKKEDVTEPIVGEDEDEEDEIIDNEPVAKVEEEDEESENDLDNDEPSEASGDYSYFAIIDHLSEEGLLDGLDKEGLDDSPEALQKAVQNTVNGLVNSYKESIPEEGKDFLNYLEKGGNPARYFESIQAPLDFDNLDLSDASVQKRVYSEHLKTLGYSSEEIDEELTDAEDNFLLEKKAKQSSKKLEVIYSQRKQELFDEQERHNVEQQNQYNNYIKEIKTTIESSNDLAGLKLSPSEKSDFQKYLLQRDGEGLTKYEREIQENPVKTQLELAYLKYKKYDFSKAAATGKTQESRRIKNLFKNSDKTNSKSKQVASPRTDSAELSAFRSLLQ